MQAAQISTCFFICFDLSFVSLCIYILVLSFSTMHIHSCFIVQWFVVVWVVGMGCLSWLQYIYILILIFLVVAVRVAFVASGFGIVV